ncbi:MAG TPA: 3' terminal RNA ribose 2'-O-methyltransferase Hen1 [Streptosporangiaceae bacterium]|nr:3' terminal RNA ribose 2'-O-methyltransferase Hen1 [Streptosporangiaceae bacterium]
MLLTITMTAPGVADGATEGAPATDLGFLLHKNPSRVQSFSVSTGLAHVFYPEITASRCTAALLLEVDPVGLVRGKQGSAGAGFSLGQYVNDRPYAASSMLAVAMARVFRTAMTGRCDARPELAARAVPLEINVPVLPCRGGPELAGELFEPLGWTAEATPIALDETFAGWGDSRYLDLRLAGELRLAEALSHLYVLLPVLDDSKHYWVSPEEVDKLIRAAGGWLAGHPHKTLITRRYLAHRSGLYRSALARLAEVDDAEPESFDNAIPVAETETETAPEPVTETAAPASLAAQRREAVLTVLRDARACRVADLGCGEGALTGALLADPLFTEVVAADVSSRALEVAQRRLRLDRMAPRQRERLRLIQSSLTYRDDRLAGLDALVLVEVIEHIDPPRLGAVERTVFTDAAPAMVIVTTPNAEHNVRYEFLADGELRHRDHRFEWTRAEFAAWAERVAAERGYQVRISGVGPEDAEVGPPSQLATFSKVSRDGSRPEAGGHDASLDYARAVVA